MWQIYDEDFVCFGEERKDEVLVFCDRISFPVLSDQVERTRIRNAQVLRLVQRREKIAGDFSVSKSILFITMQKAL